VILAACNARESQGETMSPLPAGSLRCRDGRKVRKPTRAGSPERGQPIHPRFETLRRRRDGTSNRPTRARGSPATQSGGESRTERVLWRVKAQEGIDAPGPSGLGRAERARARDRSPVGGRVRTLPMGVRRIDARNARRAGDPGRGPDRAGEKALEGEAYGRSDAARRREGRR
jgi:hypothetical protein